MPGTVHLTYDVTLTKGTDLTARLVSNLLRAIVDKMSIRMQGQELQRIQSYGDYWAMRNLFMSANRRTSPNCLMQGYDDQADPGNLTLLRSGSSSVVATGANTSLANCYGKNSPKCCSPLDFELATGRGPFHPSSFGDALECEIVFSEHSQVIISTDTGAVVDYSLSNIYLEFETVASAYLSS